MSKTAGLFSPYFSSWGGGERYMLSIAAALSGNFTVDLFAPEDTGERSASLFHLPLHDIRIRQPQELTGKNVLARAAFLSRYDIFFYMTDGSLFFPAARRNFLIIQSPLHCPPRTLLSSFKLSGWRLLCYSSFMQSVIGKRLGKNAHILHPPVDTDLFVPGKKEKIILSVGRFFGHLHNKKHDILIDVFKKHGKNIFAGWKLVIAGGSTDGKSREVVSHLTQRSKGLPVTILENPGFRILQKLYADASIYWHAAGFGEDLEMHPEKAEHFGLTTIEAMAAGAVPVVFGAGGQKDIVRDGTDGFLWENTDELVEKSQKIMKDKALFTSLSEAATVRARDFSMEKFRERLNFLVRE